jgi:HAD superfamily hydrolase (TIGR01484 family)
MQSLSHFLLESRANVRVLLFDIDDTLTTEGQLTAAAYTALERLNHAGYITIPITGRPAGWCDHIARMWPVDGIVGENGAFYFRYDRTAKKMRQRFIASADARRENKIRLNHIAAKILRDVPGTALASDQNYREADIAIDFCEDVTPLPRAEVERIKAFMEAAGLTAKISSIHVNGWLGKYDKLSTTRLFMREVFSVDLDAKKSEFAFIGDSPNDAPMFGFFPHSVGVANVRDFGDLLMHQPAYVTSSRGGAGFVELVEALLSERAVC